jgi:hypothetical protein
MRRIPRNPSGRRANPLRQLALERQRATDLIRERRREELFKSELPAMIEDQVGEQIQRLETRLVEDFQELGKKALEESTTVLNDQLKDRIENLEEMSSFQYRTLVELRDSSKMADERVSTVVDSLERTLSNAVPGFQLEPAGYSAPGLEGFRPKLIKSREREIQETDIQGGRCPKCGSEKVRRAYRKGVWEQFLRLFGVAPFRCRACRQKFNRFRTA